MRKHYMQADQKRITTLCVHVLSYIFLMLAILSYIFETLSTIMRKSSYPHIASRQLYATELGPSQHEHKYKHSNGDLTVNAEAEWQATGFQLLCFELLFLEFPIGFVTVISFFNTCPHSIITASEDAVVHRLFAPECIGFGLVAWFTNSPQLVTSFLNMSARTLC